MKGLIFMHSCEEFAIEYVNSLREVDNLFFLDTAMEAESIDSNESIRKHNELKERIVRIGKAILAKITELFDILMNIFSEFMVTNKGFMKMYDEYKKSYKPLKSTRVITYDYNPRVLSDVRTKFKDLLNDLNRELINLARGNRDENLLAMSGEALLEKVLRDITGSNNVTNVSELYLFIRQKYRGERQEKTLGIADLTEADRIVKSYSSFSNFITQEKSFCRSIGTSMEKLLTQYTFDKSSKGEDTSELFGAASKITKMINLYLQILRQQQTLHNQYVMVCRSIIKQFYRMK